MLLAAGAGTRLGPVRGGRPKCLLSVGGRPLIDRQIEALVSAGVEDITVVAGYQADQVIGHLAGRYRVVVNASWASTNSIVSLHLAAPHVAGHAFLFQNADVVYHPDLVRRFVAAPGPNACLIDPYLPHVAGEYYVELNQGRIVRYSPDVPPERSVGRSAQLTRVGEADSGGFFVRMAELIAAGGQHGFPNQAYDVLIRGEGLWPVYTAGLAWWEIDTSEDYLRARQSLSPDQVHEPEVPVPPVISRVRSFVRRPRIPWRFRWVSRVWREALRSPTRSIRQVRAHLLGRLSVEGLDLAVNGPRTLAMVYQEAHRHGLEPMLLWGTLLGCVREGGFIANDRDLDLGIRQDQARGLTGFREALRERGFRVRVEHAAKLSMVHPDHPGLYVDLDIIRPHRDGWAITHLDPTTPNRRYHYRFPHQVFASSRPARFGNDLEVLVPADPEGFLGAAYGDWRIPRPKLHYLYGPLNLEVEIVEAGARRPADG